MLRIIHRRWSTTQPTNHVQHASFYPPSTSDPPPGPPPPAPSLRWRSTAWVRTPPAPSPCSPPPPPTPLHSRPRTGLASASRPRWSTAAAGAGAEATTPWAPWSAGSRLEKRARRWARPGPVGGTSPTCCLAPFHTCDCRCWTRPAEGASSLFIVVLWLRDEVFKLCIQDITSSVVLYVRFFVYGFLNETLLRRVCFIWYQIRQNDWTALKLNINSIYYTIEH